jgi:cyanophycinase
MTGPIALVGSGEFTATMLATDAALLDLAEAAGFDRVVAVIPTAAAPDGHAVVRRWLEKAHAHYAALDAEVVEVDVRDHHDATELQHCASVETAGFVYLSGGKPDHLTASLRDTPLLDIVLERWRDGMALAGCSAGAMTLAAGWPPFGRSGGVWGSGLGVLPRLGLLPHFDRFGRMRLGGAGGIGKHTPTGWTAIGVDEDTALVHPGSQGIDGWRVEGVGGVWHLAADGVVPLDPSLLTHLL